MLLLLPNWHFGQIAGPFSGSRKVERDSSQKEKRKRWNKCPGGEWSWCLVENQLIAVSCLGLSNLCLVACGMFVNYLAQLSSVVYPCVLCLAKCLPTIFSAAHSAYGYYFLCYVLSLSPGHFSFLGIAALRVRHFRIASVIILIRMAHGSRLMRRRHPDSRKERN